MNQFIKQVHALVIEAYKAGQCNTEGAKAQMMAADLLQAIGDRLAHDAKWRAHRDLYAKRGRAYSVLRNNHHLDGVHTLVVVKAGSLPPGVLTYSGERLDHELGLVAQPAPNMWWEPRKEDAPFGVDGTVLTNGQISARKELEVLGKERSQRSTPRPPPLGNLRELAGVPGSAQGLFTEAQLIAIAQRVHGQEHPVAPGVANPRPIQPARWVISAMREVNRLGSKRAPKPKDLREANTKLATELCTRIAASLRPKKYANVKVETTPGTQQISRALWNDMTIDERVRFHNAGGVVAEPVVGLVDPYPLNELHTDLHNLSQRLTPILIALKKSNVPMGHKLGGCMEHLHKVRTRLDDKRNAAGRAGLWPYGAHEQTPPMCVGMQPTPAPQPMTPAQVHAFRKLYGTHWEPNMEGQVGEKINLYLAQRLLRYQPTPPWPCRYGNLPTQTAPLESVDDRYNALALVTDLEDLFTTMNSARTVGEASATLQKARDKLELIQVRIRIARDAGKWESTLVAPVNVKVDLETAAKAQFFTIERIQPILAAAEALSKDTATLFAGSKLHRMCDDLRGLIKKLLDSVPAAHAPQAVKVLVGGAEGQCILIGDAQHISFDYLRASIHGRSDRTATITMYDGAVIKTRKFSFVRIGE